MNIGIIGSGAREHSICYKLKQSEKVKNLYDIMNFYLYETEFNNRTVQ